MKYIKDYKIFESNNEQFLKTKEEIKKWLDEMRIKNYTISKNLKVDVDNDVDISIKRLEFIPVQFKHINGNFYCNNNKLTSLKGCPEEINGKFRCDDNQLTSLKFGPFIVEGHYECEHNKLTSLEGCPDLINGNFRCNNNKINTLKYCPLKIEGHFFLGDNELKNLEGCCPKIGDGFYLENNCLESLKGCPDVPDGTLILFDNNIKNLKDIENCNIKKISISGNPVNDILDLYFTNDLSTKLLIKYINEYDVIKGNNVILESLKEAMYMADVEFHHYINDSNIQNYIKHYTVI